MPASLYMRLRTADNTKSYILTDPAKGSFLGEGWQPGTPAPTIQGYTNAISTIPYRVKGANAAACGQNLRDLTDLLEQAARFARGEDVSMVLLDLTMKGSNPAKILTCAIKGWDAANYLPANFFDHIATTGKVDVVINLEHTVFLHTAWTYEQLITGSDWTSAPTTIVSGVTVAHIPATMPYGGNGYIEATKSSGADANFRITSLPISLTNGQPLTISMDISADASITDVRVLLWNGSTFSNIAPLAVSTAPISGGYRTRVTLIPTSTVSAYLYFQIFGGLASAKLRIGEILVVSGTDIDDGWHRTYAEHTTGVASAVYANNPSAENVLFKVNHAPYSPVVLTWEHDPTQLDYRHPAMFNLVTDQGPFTTNDIALDWWTAVASAPFTTPADADALGGKTLRYTPTGTGVARTQWISFSAFGGWRGIVTTLLNAKNTTANAFTIWMEFCDNVEVQIAETPKKIIPASASVPAWYLLGEAPIGQRRRAQKWRIAIQASVATGFIDINAMAWLRKQPGSAVIQTDAVDLGSANNFSWIRADHQWLSDRAPAVAAMETTISTIDSPVSYWTNPTVVMSGNGIAAMMLGCNGAKWRIYNTGGATLQKWRLLATRIPAYPTPE